MALGCRDVARIDFRMDEKGRFTFLECNPLPGLTPAWSDLVLISQGAGMDYRTLIGEILSGAIRRYKEREQRRSNHEKPTPAGATANGQPELPAPSPAAVPAEQR
jgi:D-alanine-D-alanine ligase